MRGGALDLFAPYASIYSQSAHRAFGGFECFDSLLWRDDICHLCVTVFLRRSGFAVPKPLRQIDSELRWQP